jgi:hypothetical protein
MGKEFNLDDFRATPEIGRKLPPRRKPPKEDLFGKLWFWYVSIFFEKRANGRMLRFFLVLLEKDFYEWGKPFGVTTAMMERAGIDRKYKSALLRTFEEWGLIFVDRRHKKNPLVYAILVGQKDGFQIARIRYEHDCRRGQ